MSAMCTKKNKISKYSVTEFLYRKKNTQNVNISFNPDSNQAKLEIKITKIESTIASSFFIIIICKIMGHVISIFMKDKRGYFGVNKH